MGTNKMVRSSAQVRWVFYQFGARPVRKIGYLATIITQRLYILVATYYEHLVRTLQRIYPEFHQNILPTSSEAMQESYIERSGHFNQLFSYQPKISVIVPVFKVKPELLNETLLSVVTQTYTNWELCIVDDGSQDYRITELLHRLKKAYSNKIHIGVNEKNLHISGASNEAIKLATGDYIALLDHDDLLLPHALAEVVRAINTNNLPDILYSDERVISEKGDFFHGPFYKPAWSPMLHLSCNYTTHLTVYSKAVIDRVGGFRVGFEGSQDHDLMLRAVEATQKPIVHIPFVLYLWRAVSGSTASDIGEKPYAVKNGIKAVGEALSRRNRQATIDWEPQTFHYRIKFDICEPKPLVTIIIPTRNRGDLLKQCIDSILAKTRYEDFEIIVIDNDSNEKVALEYLAYLNSGNTRKPVSVIRVSGPFNFALLNNQAAQIAKGQFLILLNNDTIVRTPEWIDEMLSYAQWPEIGAVGCKLLYEDESIQHAGIILQDRKIASHSLRTLPQHTNAYISMANTVHEVCAVTGACLMVSKQKYTEVGGLDEVCLPNGYGDVDFCLKLRKCGYTNIYTPYSVLTHLESRSRGRCLEQFEEQTMKARWGWDLLNDPYFNPNFQLGEIYTPVKDKVTPDLNYLLLRRYWKKFEQTKNHTQ